MQMNISTSIFTATILFFGLHSFESISEAKPSQFYDQLSWTQIQSVELANGNTVNVNAHNKIGRYLRIKLPAQCGFLSLGVTAEGTPFSPNMTYDNQAQVTNPNERRYHWYVSQNQDVKFVQLWVTISNLEIASCPATIELASNPEGSASEIDPSTPRKTVRSVAKSKYSKEITSEIAINKAIGKAQELCQSLNVIKVPNQLRCESRFNQSTWTSNCVSQFYCLPNSSN
ncbi:MAG: hypothetical protein NT027_20105 [Proteobacteria bacterium]|nr:hypothetical protein [Pseudomonadota bacterium]